MGTRWINNWEKTISITVMLIGVATIGYCGYCLSQAVESSHWLAQLKRFMERGGIG